MYRRHISLMHLTMVNGRVTCMDGSSFDAVQYSRFKYGYEPPAVGYGYGLSGLVADELLARASGRKTIVVSAPYKALPTASHAIAKALLRALSARFINEGLEPPVLVPFHKARVGSAAYAMSSEEERRRTLATLGLHIDESLVRGANVLAVDDIRITGSAEAGTRSYLEGLGPNGVWYLHAARLDEQIASRNPGLEDELNQTFPKSLDTILLDEVNRQFALNTRVLRFIMETADEAAFEEFLSVAPSHLLEQIYSGVMGSGLTYVKRYPVTFPLLETEYVSRFQLAQFALG